MFLNLLYSAIIGASLAGVALLAQGGEQPPEAAQEARGEAIAPSTVYRYDAPPSISKDAYAAIVCAAGPACDEAGAMYDVLVAAGIDPVIEAAQAMHETGIGAEGVGRSAYKNLHGVQCHNGDGRIADSAVPWGNGCAGVYASYADSVRTWANVINREYVALGLNTPALAVSKYAPISDGNDPPAYVADMERLVDQWRGETQPNVSPSQASAVGASYLLQGDVGVNVTAALNANGGALMGFQIEPGETWSFGHSIAPISALGHLPVVCGPAGCNAGGGWCDLSALYVKVADQLGLVSSFPAHAGVSDPRFPGILLDENGNGGDLLITNSTGATVVFRARVEGDLLVVEGGTG